MLQHGSGAGISLPPIRQVNMIPVPLALGYMLTIHRQSPSFSIRREPFQSQAVFPLTRLE